VIIGARIEEQYLSKDVGTWISFKGDSEDYKPSPFSRTTENSCTNPIMFVAYASMC